MDKVLSIRVSDEMVTQLAAHEERTGFPTSAFIRRCIKNGLLDENIVDAEPELPAEIASKIQVLKAKRIDESKASHATAARLRMNSGASYRPLIDPNNPPRTLEKDGE